MHPCRRHSGIPGRTEHGGVWPQLFLDGARRSASMGVVDSHRPLTIRLSSIVRKIPLHCLLSPAAQRLAGERKKVRGKGKFVSYFPQDAKLRFGSLSQDHLLPAVSSHVVSNDERSTPSKRVCAARPARAINLTIETGEKPVAGRIRDRIGVSVRRSVDSRPPEPQRASQRVRSQHPAVSLALGRRTRSEFGHCAEEVYDSNTIPGVLLSESPKSSCVLCLHSCP
jgi:hypothetical protein